MQFIVASINLRGVSVCTAVVLVHIGRCEFKLIWQQHVVHCAILCVYKSITGGEINLFL